MSTQEQRERWARMFGFVRHKWEDESLGYYWKNTDGDGFSENAFIDFSDIRGPRFGPTVLELISAPVWVLSGYKPFDLERPGLHSWTTAGRNPGQKGYVRVEHPDLGVCTMLALEAKRQQGEK